MLFSPLNMRAQPRKMLPNKRQQKARLSNIMFMIFSGLGVIVFWVGFILRPKNNLYNIDDINNLNLNNNNNNNAMMMMKKKHPTSTLSKTFDRPQPHLLVSHASVAQVDQYVNTTNCLGSMKYIETNSCKERNTCEIHFPYVELEGNPTIDLSSIKTTTTTTTAGSNTKQQQQQQQHYAVLTRKGYKALVTNVNANQDRVFVMTPLEMGQESSIPIGPDDFMMGLFDGHGPVGHGTAHFAALELPPLILRNMQRRKKFIQSNSAPDVIKSSIKDSFIHLDENIPYLETSGSTGILIVRIGMFLFLASTGDSQAFLVKADILKNNNNNNLQQSPGTAGAGAGDEDNGNANNNNNNDDDYDDAIKVSIVQSTVPHKPDQPLESARIRAAGGQVIPKMTDDTSSRVIIPISSSSISSPLGGGDAAAAAEEEEDPGDMTLALAMSRSLGDPEGKKANVVIADPNVDVIDLEALLKSSQSSSSSSSNNSGGGGSSSKFFMVVASDGLLDKIPPLEVAKRIAQSFYQEQSSSSQPTTTTTPLVACQELILQASQMWMAEDEIGYRDDISIAVKRIDL